MNTQTDDEFDQVNPLPPTGRIDIHCHLVPMIDDGCESFEQSIDCVRALRRAGFTGSICTPHVWSDQVAYNTPEHIRAWTAQLQGQLREEGEDYPLWPGGELKLYKGVIDWMKQHGPPTLADSRCVLVDFWVDKWPKWAVPAFDWLLQQRYQPILAHPERLGCVRGLEKHLAELKQMGVWLQGNLRCMTGEEGFEPNRLIRQLLREGQYDFLATDLHRADSLNARLDGLSLAEAEFGQDAIDRLIVDAPRRKIFGK